MDSIESRVLIDLMQLEREVVELRYTLALDAAERVQEALRRLGEARSPHEILERSAAELSASTHFEQTLVARVAAGELAAISASGVATPAGLVVGRPEAAAMASDGATVVDVSGHVLAQALGWTECVLAPIRVHGEADALLYAAVPPGGRALAEFDRALVERFARGLGVVLEHAVLEHAVERHRASLAALGWRRGAAPAAAAIRPPGAGDPPPSGDPLTPRELEVLRLVAQGFTNAAIAERLAIAEGTVKYHLKNMMRKLRARSRADAVARHLHATSAVG